jgi:hypothetical protein
MLGYLPTLKSYKPQSEKVLDAPLAEKNLTIKLVAKAKTSSGLKVFFSIIDQVYQTGKKVAQDFRENMNIIFDQYLPKWNYVAKPKSI